jgi:signal transduction histidine kinase
MLLLITLAVTVVLAFEGRRAVRDHREAVKKTLLDNAAFAAQRYVEVTQQSITSFVRWKVPIPDVSKGFRPDRVEFHNDPFPEGFGAVCKCDAAKHVRRQFAYDYASDSLFLIEGSGPARGKALSAPDRARLTEILRRHPLQQFRKDGWSMAFAADEAGPDGDVVGFAVFESEPSEQSGPPTRLFAVGFTAEPRFKHDMLPPLAFLEINMPRAKAYHAHKRYGILAHSRAALVRRDGDNSSEYYAQDSTYSAFGAIKVRVAIDPTAVPAMAGVAVPPLRYALIFGLTLLISILILAALILGKRQSELAAAREDFVSGVSHELRTPLAQIRMFAETLLLGRVRNEVERRRALEVIDQEARRLTALVENVLNLSRSRRGTARLAPAATELAPSVREILDTFSQMPRSRSVDFRLELEDRLVATVDPGAFRQILLNLLDNAVKYGPVGQRVSIGLAMFEKQARLWVDDEGPGIPERERERVFEPFYRATGQDTSVAGSGIGLAVVRELAVLLAGRAWVDDAPGGGARLVVEFPDAYLRAEDAAASWAVA